MSTKELAKATTDWWHYHDFNAKGRLRGLILEAKLLAKASGNELSNDEAFKAANLKHQAWDLHKMAETADIIGENKEKEWKKVTALLEEYYKIIFRR
ncbi:MAG: hypothetical protein NT129_04020 [Candidatus Aenigmarchaeota archaeon]|nr:hypothetical protein [Candidatus Aenigmarchaeota archaeon]